MKSRKFNKILISSLTLAVLFSCSRKPLVQYYDGEYGISYAFQIENWSQSVTLALDTKETKCITQIYLYANYSPELIELLTGSSDSDVQMKFLEDLDKQNHSHQHNQSYEFGVVNGVYQERLLLDFYKKEFSFEENKNLLDDLGLWDLYDTNAGCLLIKPFAENKDFKYHFLVEEGVYYNDISFAGFNPVKLK